MFTKQNITPEVALARLAALCAKAEYCEYDVRRKMHAWQIGSDDADGIVDALRREGYIDDARYCRAFVEDKWRYNRWGRDKIRMSLRAKRLPDDEISDALAAISDEEYAEVLAQLLRQKRGSFPADMSPADERVRLLRFAASRGFGQDAAYEALRMLGEEGDE